MFQSIGLDPDAEVDPKRMVTDKAFYNLFERIAQDGANGRSIAVRVGASMRCDDYGAFGLAFKSAVDLWGSFHRVERYGKVVTNIANFEVLPRKGGAMIAVVRDAETRLGLRMTNELAVSAATALSREVSRQELTPLAVCFSHEPPEDLSEYTAHFRTEIRFGAERDGFEISDDLLRSPNRLGDQGLSEFFDAHLERELEGLDPDNRLVQRVRIQITRSLSEGAPSLTEVAEQLGMSARSLQRRLREQDCVYQDMVASARRELAERLLQSTDYSLPEIAFLTGFSEQSAFSRAFKRWCGQTPQAFRVSRQVVTL